MSEKKMLFISHAEKDSAMVERFVDLLYDIGIPEESMFCSSISEIGVPIKENIYEYLRNLLDSEQVIPIFLLSDNYYSSAACLNEMGAAWMKQKDYYLFLLPGFEYAQIRGAINPARRGISLGYKSERELQNLKGDLNQFRESAIQLLHLNIERYKFWEKKRDAFIGDIQRLKMEMGCFKIDLQDCQGQCIGEYVHDGCIVNYDDTRKEVCGTIDFSKTDAEICSVIIFTGGVDVSDQYKAEKTLAFDLKVVGTTNTIEVECMIKNRNVYKVVKTLPEWERYQISLSEFGGQISEWESLQEIKFILRREEGISQVDVGIRNLEIV